MWLSWNCASVKIKQLDFPGMRTPVTCRLSTEHDNYSMPAHVYNFLQANNLIYIQSIDADYEAYLLDY